MTQLATYVFSGRNVRTNNDPISLLFIAKDVCDALGFEKARNAVAQHVDPEDLTKLPVDTGYGVKDMLAVNESGLYALIFGSKLPSAQKFKRWVTSEVLPSIRKTGSYTTPRKTLTVEHQQAVRAAIAKKARTTKRHYQTIYRALYARFQVPRYSEILDSDFDAAIRFISEADLNARPLSYEQRAKAIASTVTVPKGWLLLDPASVEQLRVTIYFYTKLMKEPLEVARDTLFAAKSTLASRIGGVTQCISAYQLKSLLEQHGYNTESAR